MISSRHMRSSTCCTLHQRVGLDFCYRVGSGNFLVLFSLFFAALVPLGLAGLLLTGPPCCPLFFGTLPEPVNSALGIPIRWQGRERYHRPTHGPTLQHHMQSRKGVSNVLIPFDLILPPGRFIINLVSNKDCPCECPNEQRPRSQADAITIRPAEEEEEEPSSSFLFFPPIARPP